MSGGDDEDDDSPKDRKGLTPREAQLLKERFGVDVTSDSALEEIEKRFEATRARLNEIEKRALEKLGYPDDDPDDAA